MNDIVNENGQLMEEVVGKVEEATPCNLLNDVEAAIGLVKQLKVILDIAHPSVSSLVRKLLFS